MGPRGSYSFRAYPFRAMGSPCELRLYGRSKTTTDAVAKACFDEVMRLERKYTRFRDDSVTAEINRSAGDGIGVEVDDETACLLDFATTGFRESDGLFDITSGILRRVWDFKAKRVPTQQEIDALQPCIGWDKVRWRRPRLELPLRGMELDFGGYVKEYAADCVAELCRRSGVAHGLIDLGGDLAVMGPHPDGTPWLVGVRHPRRPEASMATVALSSGGIASSGDYERCMVVGGRRYGHILSPVTGWPVEGLASVSVVAEQCVVAGTASTIAMLKGSAEGPAWLDALGLPNLRMHPNERISGTLAPAAAQAP